MTARMSTAASACRLQLTDPSISNMLANSTIYKDERTGVAGQTINIHAQGLVTKRYVYIAAVHLVCSGSFLIERLIAHIRILCTLTASFTGTGCEEDVRQAEAFS